MANSETETTPPLIEAFHPGEQELQERVGVKDMMTKLGPRIMRDHMPLQHRELFEKLPILIIGALDEQGRPWASLLVGEPGFMQAPDPYHLEVSANSLPLDPVLGLVKPGTDVGLLSIELETRRRNRMNATVENYDNGKLSLKVKQSFGNCPRYIQKRQYSVHENNSGAANAVQLKAFNEESKTLIQSADSFFISSLFDDGADQPNRGVDVSHRGGLPGFIRVEDETTLVFPDYNGNHFFNTLGNIHLNPKAGLLFVDYEKGTLLYLTGTAETLWEDSEIANIPGAERLVRFHLEAAQLVSNALPMRWEFLEYSPVLAKL